MNGADDRYTFICSTKSSYFSSARLESGGILVGVARGAFGMGGCAPLGAVPGVNNKWHVHPSPPWAHPMTDNGLIDRKIVWRRRRVPTMPIITMVLCVSAQMLPVTHWGSAHYLFPRNIGYILCDSDPRLMDTVCRMRHV